MKRIGVVCLLFVSGAAGQWIEPPEAMTFYTPRGFFDLIGVPQPEGPEQMFLCNVSKGLLVAKVEWQRQGADDVLEHEAFLRPGMCSVRTLAPGEEPDARGHRTTWQRATLGARMGPL